MNRPISIGLAIAVAPAMLLAVGQWTESSDMIYVSEVALFNIALPLGGLLVMVGLYKKIIQSQLQLAKGTATQSSLSAIRRLWGGSITGLTNASAPIFDKIYLKLFWTSLIGLIAFSVAFGTPFIGTVNSGKVIAMAGCKPPGFDSPAVCPSGSFVSRFAPLTGWTRIVLLAPLVPIIFIQQFWDLLLGWLLVTLVFYFKSEKWVRKME
jgi:hypothetical protein